jgi:hypothetical protein
VVFKLAFSGLEPVSKKRCYMNKLVKVGKRLGLGLAGSLAFAAAANAQAITPFATTDLDGARAVIVAFLAVGAAIVLGFVLYMLGKKGAKKAASA